MKECLKELSMNSAKILSLRKNGFQTMHTNSLPLNAQYSCGQVVSPKFRKFALIVRENADCRQRTMTAMHPREKYRPQNTKAKL